MKPPTASADKRHDLLGITFLEALQPGRSSKFWQVGGAKLMSFSQKNVNRLTVTTACFLRQGTQQNQQKCWIVRCSRYISQLLKRTTWWVVNFMLIGERVTGRNHRTFVYGWSAGSCRDLLSKIPVSRVIHYGPYICVFFCCTYGLSRSKYLNKHHYGNAIRSHVPK